VSEAADGKAALRAVADVTPDVVLMDLHMPASVVSRQPG
jgi:YesN/AraC family two-component response regulator